MPFIILMGVIAFVAPYLLCSLAEWTFDPASWSTVTRVVIALVYASVVGWILHLLNQAKKVYFAMSVRKKPEGDWQ